jgi:hypothetical protein
MFNGSVADELLLLRKLAIPRRSVSWQGRRKSHGVIQAFAARA